MKYEMKPRKLNTPSYFKWEAHEPVKAEGTVDTFAMKLTAMFVHEADAKAFVDGMNS